MKKSFNYQNQNIFIRNPKKTITVVVIISILILDFSVTKVYRWYKSKQPTPMARIYDLHPVYSHGFKKNSFVIEEWRGIKIPIYTNSLGFKDRTSREISLTSDKKRIVFIGDSFTEGVSYEYGDTFVGIIDAALAKRGIEVLNAGCMSYSPFIYWEKINYLIEDVGLNFDELIVFLDISDAWNESYTYYCCILVFL